jgi:hypothetical protein
MVAIRCGAIWAACSVLLALGPMAHAGDASEGSIVPVDRALCDDMKAHKVIKAGAVVGCERLSLVRFSYLGFDGAVHGGGEIMVMAGTNSLSLHAYGLAIDLNPLENPYVQRADGKLVFSPPAGAAYTNRFKGQPEKQLRLGLAEAVIDVFADGGFVIWGGYWNSSIDYQHFQVSRGFAEQLARLAPGEAKAAFAQHVERYRACRRKGGAEAGRASCIASVGD